MNIQPNIICMVILYTLIIFCAGQLVKEMSIATDICQTKCSTISCVNTCVNTSNVYDLIMEALQDETKKRINQQGNTDSIL